ncbi:MFS general substrate transporter [Ceratobasidium sp. AG-I]|nr:MFS general substrate transporter [Ceratobasidium sp. AG-I]
MSTLKQPERTEDDSFPPSPSSTECSLPDPESSQERPQQTPVPKLQLLSVCVSRIAEPLAYSQIFPYVNQMVWDLGVTDNPKQIGFYSGIIDSAFAFAQMFTIYAYGSLSDRIGRKPVVLFGTFGVAITAATFGLSKTFTQMVASRTLAGLLSGYVAVMHSVLGEITDATNQAAAYPIYGLCYPIGSLIGPLIGGALAEPNKNIPHLVPSILHGLFEEYPYLLPSMVATIVAAMSLLFVMIFMKETLPSKIRSKLNPASGTSTPSSSYGSRGRQNGSSQSTSPSPTIAETSRGSSMNTRVGEPRTSKSANENDSLLKHDEEEPHKWGAWELLKLPQLRQLYRSSILLSFEAESYVVVFVLFSYTKIQDGGLGFDPAAIGFALATAGFISFALQLLVMPTILKRYNPSKTFSVCMSTWPVAFAIPPILNAIARASSDNGAHEIGKQAKAAIWVGIWIAQLLTKFGCMAYSLNMIIARQSAPDQRALGATNGLNQLSLCVARMFAPTAVSTLFALSTDHNILGGQFVWVFMVVFALLGLKFAAPPLV